MATDTERYDPSGRVLPMLGEPFIVYANGQTLTPQLARLLLNTLLLNAGVDPPQVIQMGDSQLEAWRSTGLVVPMVEQRSKTFTLAGCDVRVSDEVPLDTIVAMRNGVEVGRLANIGTSGYKQVQREVSNG